MKKSQRTIKIFRFASCIFMMLALLWLTISVPFIFRGEQQKNIIDKTSAANLPVGENQDEDIADPFSNSTEEKTTGSSGNISEEYLHHTQLNNFCFTVPFSYNQCENVKTYIAFHGELLSPPPEL